MTTVGYGDIARSEDLVLRLAIVLIVLIGSFTASLLTLTIVNFFKLTPSEARAYLSKYSTIQLTNGSPLWKRSSSGS
jgi:voltage-gated potassium channel Kch